MEEEQLINDSLKGNEKAMNELVRAHWDRVYHHCLRMVQEENTAQDLTQETFLHAFSHLATFQRKAKFSTWIWRIAHNLCLNYLKKPYLKDQPLYENVLQDNHTPESDEGFTKQIEEALKELDEKHRLVFEMYDLQHIPQKEIAARLKISHGTVRSRLHYAREKVRMYFKKFPPVL